MVYTMYMSVIYYVYTIYSCLQDLKNEYAFLKFYGVYIALYTPMTWVYSNRIREKKRKEQFNIQGICMVYTMYIPALSNIHGISMVYTMNIPCKIFIGVPDGSS